MDETNAGAHVMYLTFSILNICEMIGGYVAGATLGLSWVANLGHGIYAFMISLTSIWMWCAYSEATEIDNDSPSNPSVDAFYSAAMTLKWYMFVGNWVPIGLLTWDIWYTQSSATWSWYNPWTWTDTTCYYNCGTTDTTDYTYNNDNSYSSYSSGTTLTTS